MNDQPGKDLRTDRMQSELEVRDDPEIAAATAERPEQIFVLAPAGSNPFTLGCNHVHASEVVYRHAKRPRQPAKTATQRQSSNAAGRVYASRQRERERL